MEKNTSIFCGNLQLTMVVFSQDLKIVLDVAYEDMLRKVDKVWCVKGYTVARSNSLGRLGPI